MAENKFNLKGQRNASFKGIVNIVFLSFVKHTFENDAALTLAALETLCKLDDPTQRMYKFESLKSDQMAVNPVTTATDFSDEWLYDKITQLTLRKKNVTSKIQRNTVKSYSGATVYVYFVYSQDIILGQTVDDVLIQPIKCTVTVSSAFGGTADHEYQLFNVLPENANFLKIKYEKEIIGMGTIEGFENVKLEAGIGTPSATSVEVKVLSVMETIDGVSVKIGGLEKTDFVFLKTSDLTPQTISSIEYNSALGTYTLIGTGFVSGKVYLAGTSTISQNVEATNELTVTIA